MRPSLIWAKSGPDALEMGCLYHPRKQTSVSYAAGCIAIRRYGGAMPSMSALTAYNGPKLAIAPCPKSAMKRRRGPELRGTSD